MDLLEQCQQWHEADEHQKIIDAIQAVPEQERTAAMDLELARAYNNIADPAADEGKRLLKKAIALMQPHKAELSEDYSWNFRMAYAYYYLDQEGRALQYFEKALEKHPGDDPAFNTRADIEYFIGECKERLALPAFEETFRERTLKAWNAFVKGEAELRRLMDEDTEHERGDELIAMCSQILEQAFADVSFELGFNGEKYELILTPEGDHVKLFELVYFCRHAPEAVYENWNILVGRQRHEDGSIGIRTGEWDVCADDVDVWIERAEGTDTVKLAMYSGALSELCGENKNQALFILYTLTDQVLGEIAHMRYVDSLDMLDEPKETEPVPLCELARTFEDMGFDLSNDAEALLNVYNCYTCKPDENPDAPWRFDIMSGSTNCAAFINEYYNGESDDMDSLHDDGAAAGFFCYPLDGFTGEDRNEQIFDFRDKLEETLSAAFGPDILTLTGGATGLYCGYVDFIAWDLEPALRMAKEFFAASGLAWASFHVFRHNVQTVSLFDKEDAEAAGETDTGSGTAQDIPVYTPQNADAFYAQIEQWNDTDQYSRCIRALDAVLMEHWNYRSAYALARALENCAIIGESEQGCPPKKAARLLCRAIDVLEDVRADGENKPEWNMRMAYAYQYLEQEALALKYARRWAALDPEDADAQAVIEECERKLAEKNAAASAPPVDAETGSLLSRKDIEALQAFDDGCSGWFGKMIGYLVTFIKAGVSAGRFTEEQARADVQTALWFSFARNNMGGYMQYYCSASWMRSSECNAAGCGTWYYRYSVALTYCGKLAAARAYAEEGVAEDPGYVWGWLHAAKLRAHFGDTEGALKAVARGLELEPGDYEFTTLKAEIEQGASLEQMLYHVISPSADTELQSGNADSEIDEQEIRAKQQELLYVAADERQLVRFFALFHPTFGAFENSNPYCSFPYDVQGHSVQLVFLMNAAALSKLKYDWLVSLKNTLDEGGWLMRLNENGICGTLDTVTVTAEYQVSRRYQAVDRSFFYLDMDDAPAEPSAENDGADELDTEPETEQDEAADKRGMFSGFVLLSEAGWDKAALIRDLKDHWDIDASEDGSDARDDALVFETGDMIGIVSVCNFPVPYGETELNAENNYMWPQAVQTAKAHKAHIMVAAAGKEEDPIERGKLFVKLVSSCLHQQNATGVYTSGVVFEPRFYERFAEMLKDNELPIFNWIWFGLYRSEHGMSGYTYGMDMFGKDEMEVLDADAEPADVHDFLASLVSYVLENDATLHDGETIGFSADDKHRITRSAGVSLPDTQLTLKISYAPEPPDAAHTQEPAQ